jgi:hypothetical protein
MSDAMGTVRHRIGLSPDVKSRMVSDKRPAGPVFYTGEYRPL